MSTCSSFEGLTGSTGGWTFPCPTCKPCAECICNSDSVTGLCPRDLCPGSPTFGVTALEGTFVATSSLGGGDICLTTLTVHATFFRMVSFRVDSTTYARSQRPHPQQVTGQFAGALQSGGPNLCDFPDAPGAMEGRITVLPPTDSDMIAKLRLTYVDGLPLGVTRIVNIYDSCPVGLLARFEPVTWVPIAYNDVLGLNPPRYTYLSGSGPGISGYKFNEINQAQAEGVASIVLKGPAENTRDLTTIALTSAYSGFFEFGTTRKRYRPRKMNCDLNMRQTNQNYIILHNVSVGGHELQRSLDGLRLHARTLKPQLGHERRLDRSRYILTFFCAQ